ncbi:glycosyltransferase family 4 protein [Candidatus Azambacteria bacterium]|nr:glycosyltransferase family 4 protein [Candidatus Azambacteria bacterium]
MKIGIHVGSAFAEKRTGVEEYAYRVILNLAGLEESKDHEFILYSNPKVNKNFPSLPKNFLIRELKFPFFWTKLRLAFELFLHPVDALFVPANFLPIFFPNNTTITIHGVEFEYLPKGYFKYQLSYLRRGTKEAIKYAKKIITVSDNTKNDLIKLYNADSKNIHTVHHGVFNLLKNSEVKQSKEKYILYIGRIERKKNIIGMIEAFEIAKKKFKIPHKFILLGGDGYGYDKIKKRIDSSSYKDDIKMKGYVSEKEKESFLSGADIFLFSSFYEGFGMPILEAQVLGAPVITSNISSMPEVAGDGALMIDPKDSEEMAEAIYKISSDENLRKNLIEKGFKNAEKYSWERCAKETLDIILKR